MINIVDVLSTVQDKLSKATDYASGLVDKIIEKSDAFMVLTDVSSEETNVFEGMTSAEIASLKTTLKTAMTDVFDDCSMTLPNGRVVSLTVQDLLDDSFGLYDINTDECLMYFGRIFDPQPPHASRQDIILQGNLADCYDTFGDWINDISVGVSKNEVILKSIGLAEKGELTVSNFTSTISEYVEGAEPSLKLLIDSIRDGLISGDVNAQAGSLIAVLQDVWKPAENAAYDDETCTINFEDNDYKVSTSLFSSMKTVLQIGTAILSIVMSFVNPVIGIAVSVIGNGIATVVDMIDKNDDSKFQFYGGNKRDNDCFFIPFVQKTISANSVPLTYIEYLQTHPILKLQNGIMALYAWYSDSTKTDINVEIFASATADVLYNEPDVTDFEKKTLYEWVTASPNGGFGYNITGRIPTFAAVTTNIMYWLGSQSMPGGLGANYSNPIYSTNELNNLALRVLRNQFKLFSQIALSLKGVQNVSYNNVPLQAYFDPIELWNRWSDLTPTQQVIYVWSWLNHCLGDRPLDQTDNIFKNYYSGNNLSVAYVVNQGIPALRNLFSTLSDQEFAPLLSMFDIIESNFTNDLNNLGVGYKLVLTTAIASKGNCYVAPPHTIWNIWFRVALAAVAVAAVTITAFIVRAKVKRRIAYKSAQERNHLNKLADRYAKTGSYDDFKVLYKDTKKYNKWWGKLSGTTYDYTNKWVDYTSSSTQSATEQMAVISLIKGSF